ncbi:HNH endonuclease [Leptolyngbya sp. 'hensonii']|uniref:HNH endonuclease n=1 Tax=Leptolyngbya sp. 'hensonii' TaxID=1922337 RepID=UPI0009FB1284|nr:HNH endonuclease [Leptolyngbya sp. 'hensonii']
MAREDLSELYQFLRNSRFSFMGTGEFHISEIYSRVKNHYPKLCDDLYLRSMNGTSNRNEPAWKHTVRTVLNDLKRKGTGIVPRNQEDSSLRGYWLIGDLISPQQSQKKNTVKLESEENLFPDEVDESEVFREGAILRVSVNAYERNFQARQKCIEHYGVSCFVCGFNFGEFFGELGEGFIHVHHLCPISEIAGEYEVDPVKDLRPVCPNCHAMIHRRSPSLSIEEIVRLKKSLE